MLKRYPIELSDLEELCMAVCELDYLSSLEAHKELVVRCHALIARVLGEDARLIYGEDDTQEAICN